MNKVYDAIKEAFLPGVGYEEAQQLFLWMFCVEEAIPCSLRGERVDKEALIDAFERLTTEGFIMQSSGPRKSARERLAWRELPRAFLSGSVTLDPSFVDAASRYLRAAKHKDGETPKD